MAQGIFKYPQNPARKGIAVNQGPIKIDNDKSFAPGHAINPYNPKTTAYAQWFLYTQKNVDEPGDYPLLSSMRV